MTRLIFFHSTYSLLLTFCLWTLVTRDCQFVASYNVTFEPCSKKADCRKDLLCLSKSGAICMRGMTCSCAPSGPSTANFCNRANLTCPDREGCAESQLSGNKFCVACSVIQTNANYPPLNKKKVCKEDFMSAPSPSPSQRPLRYSYDLCGVYDRCAKGLTCRNADDKNMCNRNHFRCICKPKSQKKCSDDFECKENLETCVEDDKRMKYCVSCNRFNSDADLVQVTNSSKRCTNETLLPPPNYFPRPNGQAYDSCTGEEQCRSPLRCANNPKKSFLMTCGGKDLPKKCTKGGKECIKGEVCAILDELRGDQICVSSSMLEQLEWNGVLFTKIEEFPKRGRKNIGDSCKADWQCRNGLQCLIKDVPRSNIDASCLWRDDCYCEAHFPQPCESQKDCRNKEKCIERTESFGRNYCSA